MPHRTANPVIVFNDAGRVVDANEAAARMIGVKLADLRRMHLRDTFHPDELAEGEERLRNMRVGERVRVERWLRCCDRRYKRVAVEGTRRAIGGYRAEFTILSPEPVDLPSRLPLEQR